MVPTKRSYILQQKKAADLFKYVWPFRGHQALKGYRLTQNKMQNDALFQGTLAAGKVVERRLLSSLEKNIQFQHGGSQWVLQGNLEC